MDVVRSGTLSETVQAVEDWKPETKREPFSVSEGVCPGGESNSVEDRNKSI